MSDIARFAKFSSLLSCIVISAIAALFAEINTGKPAQANPSAQTQSSAAQIAAISQPTLPTVEPQSMIQSEADLIQQLSGQATSVKSAAAQTPSFAPPSKGSSIVLPPPPPAEESGSPLVASTLSATDVKAGLLPAQPRSATPVSVVRGIRPTVMKELIDLESAPTEIALNPSRSKSDLMAQSGRNADSLTRSRPFLRSTAITPPNLTLQGVYLYQGDQTSARARLFGVYPLTPNALVGATLDLTTGNAFTDTPGNGFNLTELYFATSPRDIPNLRFVVGQIDLTSYFDRNSFAKDGASQFFNPVFQTNPALSATGIASRPGALMNFSLTDNIEAKAAVFSSSRSLGDFALDGFAGELGVRYGNLIVRGTYASDRDSGSNSGFQEIFQISRGGGQTGVLQGDREQAYGMNAELFIPSLKMGIFGRYGRYNNLDLGEGADTFSGGISFLDLLAPDDRLGLAYGRALSSDRLRRQSGADQPDVLELYYDFRLLSNLRLGFSIQGRNNFSETIAGIRLRTEFDVTPRGRQAQ
ncbi:carbohydrate porin [Leptolyngbya sp. FACHB-17]|uniref:carbohydrate porin n=1 Tax=unclassified Leptolyngbya TaxID=2650499 RepID=UPI0016808357|nr:carbohydrate porin [Leptolyngbya sp. FACHB-17]MBD2079334.1 porin [Leptolyngbya sp. FACHB-17]